jgi:hypothetical protein
MVLADHLLAGAASATNGIRQAPGTFGRLAAVEERPVRR